MSSSFLKTSPYSSSYGLYGAGVVNPYASYFGSPPHTATSSSTSSSTQNPAPPPATVTSPFTSPSFGGSSLAQGPSGGFNPVAAGSVATSPLMSSFGGGGGGYTSPGFASGPGFGISGGSSPYFMPQTAQTRIIGGMANSPAAGRPSNTVTSPSPSSLWGFTSPGSGGSHDNSQHHEPMHYSPVSTGSIPPSPTNYAPTNNPVYLPCYFLGLDQPHHYQGGSPPSPGSGGTARLSGPGAFMSPSPASGRSAVKRTVLFEPKSFPEADTRAGETKGGASVKKVKGPPIHGFGSSESTSSKDFLEAVIRTETSPPISDQPVSSPISVTTHTFGSPSGFSPRGNSSSKCWVTIFGFPAGASSFIVTNFSTLGKIMEVKCTPGSNWLHIRFSDPIESRRALSRNGKVLGQSIMVGVIPSDSKVIEEADKANISSSEFGSPGSSAPSPILKEKNVGARIRPGSTGESLKSRIRPLATGYNYNPHMASPPRSVPGTRSAARDTFAVGRENREGVPVPTPATGIVSKTLEFFFGW